MPQVLFNSLVVGAMYSLFGVSFALIYSTARFVHFAHAAIFTVAAYGALCGLRVLHGLPALALLLGVVAGMALVAGMELLVYRPLRRRGAGPLGLLLASLGLFIIVQNGVSLTFGEAVQTIRDWPVRTGFAAMAVRITSLQVAIVMSCAVSLGLTWIVVRYTRAGLLMRAVANDRDLAASVGVNTNTVILAAFLSGSLLAGIAGILMGYYTDLTPLMGYRAMLFGVVTAVVGGVGSVRGAIAGGLLVGLIEQFSGWWLPVQWQELCVFGVLLIFLAGRPHGLFGHLRSV